MPLTEKQKRHLRGLAHHLKPVVMIGDAGLSEGVLRELDLTIEHHELIKVKVKAADRDERETLIRAMCESANAELVQRIGHVAVIYRRAKQPRINLPK